MSKIAAAPHLAKAAILWTRWQATHESRCLLVADSLRSASVTHGLYCSQDDCVRAMSSAVNILERLQVLTDDRCFSHLRQQSGTKDDVLAKQLASLNRSLGVLHNSHEELQMTVKELERLYIEALRSISCVMNLAAYAMQSGPGPTGVEGVELLQDMWIMCRDELLLKIAAVSLLTVESDSTDMAVLLRCYSDQPNIDVPRVDKAFALIKETTPQH